MSDGLNPKHWRWEQDPSGVGTLWFDHATRDRNVLDMEAIEELDQRLDAIESIRSLRGVIIRGAKASGFSSGADLGKVLDAGPDQDLEVYLRRGLSVLDRIKALEFPTAAVVHGECQGGGLELALSCRSRIALASTAPVQIGTPEVQVGLLPAWGAIGRLTRLLAPKDALDLLLGGNPIGFLQAKSQGLVQRLVAHDEAERLLDVLGLEVAAERGFDPQSWESELQFAREKFALSSADHPESLEAIFEVIQLDLLEGRQAAQEAAINLYLELAARPATRRAVEVYLRRGYVHE